MGPGCAILLVDLAGDLEDIRAMIPLFGEGHGVAEELQVARPDGFAQELHLASSVVVIVFSGHLVARVLEEPRDDVAQHRLAAVPDGQRASGVGAHKLDQSALASSNL